MTTEKECKHEWEHIEVSVVYCGKCDVSRDVCEVLDKCKNEMRTEGLHISGQSSMIQCSNCGYEQEAKDHQIIGNVIKRKRRR